MGGGITTSGGGDVGGRVLLLKIKPSSDSENPRGLAVSLSRFAEAKCTTLNIADGCLVLEQSVEMGAVLRGVLNYCRENAGNKQHSFFLQHGGCA